MSELRVVRSVDVACNVDRAFALWVDQFSIWWPMTTHSFGKGRAVDVRIDGRPGGAITEHWDDGTTRTWGQISVWEPPNRLCHTWYLGFTPDQATDVEVRFEAIEGARTRVTVTQTGFERLGDVAVQRRDGNEHGWASVLRYFVARSSTDPRAP